MDYKKIIKDNYNLHLLKTDRFKTIKIAIRFTKKYNKKEYLYNKLLVPVLLHNGTKKYKDTASIAKRCEYLYNLSIGAKSITINDNSVFEVTASILNPKYVEHSLYKDSFEVINELLNKPIINNGEFNDKIFKLEKDNMITGINNTKDSINSYGSIKFDEHFYKDTLFEDCPYNNLDLMKKVTNSDIYKSYLNLFNSYKIDVLVLGDFEEDIVIKEIDKLMKGYKKSNNYSTNRDIKVEKDHGIYSEEYNSNQSLLYMGLYLNDLTTRERDYVSILYNVMLGSMNNSSLFVNVREKNSLCYSIGSSLNKCTNTMVISAGINRKNYEKSVRIIKETIESMKEEKTIKGLINNAKKTLEISCNDYYDSSSKMIGHYYEKEFYNNVDIEEKRKELLSVSIDEVINVAKKVEIGTMFLLEGIIDEEN